MNEQLPDNNGIQGEGENSAQPGDVAYTNTEGKLVGGPEATTAATSGGAEGSPGVTGTDVEDTDFPTGNDGENKDT